jgi:hypothetical protein
METQVNNRKFTALGLGDEQCPYFAIADKIKNVSDLPAFPEINTEIFNFYHPD